MSLKKENEFIQVAKRLVPALALTAYFAAMALDTNDVPLSEFELNKRSEERSRAYLATKGCKVVGNEIPFCPE